MRAIALLLPLLLCASCVRTIVRPPTQELASLGGCTCIEAETPDFAAMAMSGKVDTTTVYEFNLSIDVDNELVKAWEETANPPVVVEDRVMELFREMQEIYLRDLRVKVNLVRLKVWREPDPFELEEVWNRPGVYNNEEALNNWRVWGAPAGNIFYFNDVRYVAAGGLDHVDRNCAMLMTGRRLTPNHGGAWASTACNNNSGFCLVGNLSPYYHPMQSLIFCHEPGHVLGSGHDDPGYVGDPSYIMGMGQIMAFSEESQGWIRTAIAQWFDCMETFELGTQFIRGDCNRDGQITMVDLLQVSNHLFAGAPEPACMDAGDANDDGTLTMSDVLWISNYLYVNGPEPKPPFPGIGEDPTPDELGCGS